MTYTRQQVIDDIKGKTSSPIIQDIYTNPLGASEIKGESHGGQLGALNGDLDVNDTIMHNVRLGKNPEIVYDNIDAINKNVNSNWHSDYTNTTKDNIDNKISDNLNNQLKNINTEYKDSQQINQAYRNINLNNAMKNNMVTSDINDNLTKLQKTADDIATKSRIVEINHEYSERKNKRINALKIGLIIAFLMVVPLVFAISQHISWPVFFVILVFTTVMYGIYLVYIFTKQKTDPYTSPYTSDYQAFQDWLIGYVGQGGDDFIKCNPCPKKCTSEPDAKSCSNLEQVDCSDSDNDDNSGKDTDVTIGDNKGYVYYDGSTDAELVTPQSDK